MKTVGLIGGMSWESTASYYRLINEGVKRELGGFHSAKILLLSVDFAEVEAMQMNGRWDDAGAYLADAAQRLEQAGADCMLICTNTMHKVAEAVASAITIPLLHIADATAHRIVEDGIEQVGLLGTSFTMEETFYRGRLEEQYGLKVCIPDEKGRAVVHRVIFDELCLGKIEERSRQRYQQIVSHLAEDGAQAIILGCTEIALLLKEQDVSLPLYDTTLLHAEAAVKEIISG